MAFIVYNIGALQVAFCVIQQWRVQILIAKQDLKRYMTKEMIYNIDII
jgi:hypothetical protein